MKRHMHKFDAVGEINGVTPIRSQTESKEPLRVADFNKDVRPFAKGVASSCFALVFGSVTGLMFLIPKVDNSLTIDIIEALTIGFLLAIAAGGFAYGFMLLLMKNDFMDRLWKNEESITDFQPEVLPEIEDQPIFLQIGNSRTLIPSEPERRALSNFFFAILEGRAAFSEVGGAEKEGARHYGYTNSDWQRLRNMFLRNKLAQWKKEGHPKQGISLTELGWSAIEAVSKQGSDLLENYIQQ